MTDSKMTFAEANVRLEKIAQSLTAAIDANLAAKDDPEALRHLVGIYGELTSVLIAQIHMLTPRAQLRADLELIGEVASELGAEYQSAWQRVSVWLEETK